LILTRSTHPGWLSNAYLVGDPESGVAVAVDTGAPLGAIFSALDAHGLRLAAILATHRHVDHVAGQPELARRTGSETFALRGEAEHIRGALPLEDGETRRWGGIRVTAVGLPGHTVHHGGYLVDGVGLFSGDCLFAGSVGACSGSSAGSFEELRRSIVERILALPDETQIYPGHAEATSVGRERTTNPFVRVMTGLDAAGTGRCLALGRPARLVVLARDVDGSTKAWVRFMDMDADLILSGRRVEVRVGIPGSRERTGPRAVRPLSTPPELETE
jgi:hydroxyacylglutathione hydrolase